MQVVLSRSIIDPNCGKNTTHFGPYCCKPFRGDSNAGKGVKIAFYCLLLLISTFGNSLLILGVGPVGVLIKNSVQSVLCKIMYFPRKRPITLSTWILTLAIPLVFSTSRGSSCVFFLW